MIREIKTIVHEFDSVAELRQEERDLALKAEKAANKAYAPYSRFKVGASILLENGQVVDGSNQENAAYPSGICAERVAISYASANFPDLAIRMIAIAALNEETLTREPVSPCGFCRQVMIETEQKQNTPLRIILVGRGKVQVIDSASHLLPLCFDGSFFSRG